MISFRSMASLLTVTMALYSTDVNAFSVTPSRSGSILTPMTEVSATSDVLLSSSSSTQLQATKTQLNYRQGNEDDDLYAVVLNNNNVVVSSTVAAPAAAVAVDSTSSSSPSLAELPRRHGELVRQTQLLETEMLVGRVAMIAAVFMMGNELLTGISLPEQIEKLL